MRNFHFDFLICLGFNRRRLIWGMDRERSFTAFPFILYHTAGCNISDPPLTGFPDYLFHYPSLIYPDGTTVNIMKKESQAVRTCYCFRGRGVQLKEISEQFLLTYFLSQSDVL